MFKKFFVLGGSSISALFVFNNIDLSNSFKSAFSLSDDTFVSVKKWNSRWDITDTVDGSNGITKQSRATRHILLIRHGQYVNMDSDADCKLTPLGQQQANYTGLRLKEMDIKYDRIIHSTMTRAIQTAQIISKQNPLVKLVQDDDLIEGVPYVNEPSIPYWNPTKDVIDEDHMRIEKAFKKYFHRAPSHQEKDSYEILVCHANVIRYMLCRVLQFPPEGWIRFSLDHASISWVSIRPDGHITVRSIGNSGFMPPSIISVN